MHTSPLGVLTLSAIIASTHSFTPRYPTTRRYGLNPIELQVPATERSPHLISRQYRTKRTSKTEISSTTGIDNAQNIDAGIKEKSDKIKSENIGKVAFLLPHDADTRKSKFGTLSPYGNPSILEAAEQLQRKVHWFSDGKIDAEIFILPENEDDQYSLINKESLNVDALIAFHLESDGDLKFAKDVFESRRIARKDNICQFALNCGLESKSSFEEENILPLCGPYDPSSPSLTSDLFPWTELAAGKRLKEQMEELFERWTSDDFTYAIMLFFNQFSGSEVDWVKYSIDATWEKVRPSRKLSSNQAAILSD